jgi:branched-chain amino acid aminotransferase
MTQPVGYINGRFGPAAEIALPIFDRGFLWGAVITDRLRTFGRRLFRLDEHLRRFRQSCAFARVPQPRSDADLAAISGRLIEESWAGQDLGLVWLATPGPTLIAYAHPIDTARIARLHRDGARLVSAPVGAAVDPRIKHRSRLAWWVATQAAHDHDPDAEPLLVDPAMGHVLETPTANLVAVIDGIVTTPPTGTVLPGVSLGVVRELCEAHAIPFAERPLTLDDLGRASEVLLTNTTYCVAGVSRIDDRPVPFPGPILHRLLDAWTELVGVDVRPPAES